VAFVGQSILAASRLSSRLDARENASAGEIAGPRLEYLFHDRPLGTAQE